MNHDEVIGALAEISMLWPNFELPSIDAVMDAMIEVTLRQWADLSAAEVRAAIDSLCQEGRDFAPPVGAGAARAHESARARRGDGPPGIDEAWGEVRRQIAHRGRWAAFSDDPLEWSHPMIERVVGHLGWDSLCSSTNEVADRAHFVRLYEAATARGVSEVAPSRALGGGRMVPEIHRASDEEVGDHDELRAEADDRDPRGRVRPDRP